MTITSKDVEDLSKALQVGGYTSAPGGLTNGAALQVEDLDVTLKLVTFRYVRPITVAQLNRFLNRLRKHGILFKTTEYHEKDWLLRDRDVRHIEILVGKSKRKLIYQLEE